MSEWFRLFSIILFLFLVIQLFNLGFDKHKRLNTFEEKPKIQKLFDNYQLREQLQSSLPTSPFQVINKEVLDFVQHSKHYRNYCSLQPTPKLIFYNRIGKAGSSSLLTWMYQIKHETNSFEQINYEGKLGNDEHLKNEQEFVFQFYKQYSTQRPTVFERHVHYVNFSYYNFPQPTYLNMVREPAARYISQFYFWKSLNSTFGDEVRQLNYSIEDCLAYQKIDPKGRYGCPSFNYQTLYFCGHDERCVYPVDETTFQLAKKNLLDHYEFVAVLEQFNMSTTLLQRIFPVYFASYTPSSTPHTLSTFYSKPPEEIYKLTAQANSYDNQLYYLATLLLKLRAIECSLDNLHFSPVK